MPVASTIKMRAHQFLQLGEDPPGVRLELVEGEIVVSPSPIPEHSTVILELGRMLLDHVEENDLGEVFGDVDTILDNYNVRRPDLLFFSKSRLDFVGEKAMEGPPDLAVEIISPSRGTVDRKEKFNEYRKAGVQNYWIIDPKQRSFEGYVLKNRRYVLAGKASGGEAISLPTFEGLSIPLAKLWRKKRR